VLFDIDLRLRPEGGERLLVSSIDAFRRYQRESAWTWEHSAHAAGLRGRSHGGRGVRGGGARSADRRDDEKLRETCCVREQLLRGHPNDGICSISSTTAAGYRHRFIVQMLVLAHAHRRPSSRQRRQHRLLNSPRSSG